MAKYTSEHPGPVRLSNKITIDIDKFPQDKFKFLYVRLDENICGDLPYGELKMKCIEIPAQEKKFLETNFFKITLEQEDPVDKYEIYCFVVHRDWSPEVGTLTLNFVCVPNTDDGKNGKFFSKTKRKKYEKKKIQDVIKETWEDTGNPRFRWKTHADPPPENWWQDRWTDQDFITRLGLCVRKKTLMCYDFEGLMIKDIIDWPDRVTGKPEPDRYVSGYESMQPINDNISSTYHFRMYRPIENACMDGEYKYGREISKYFKIEVHEDTFRIFSKDDDRGNFEERQEIYKYNNRFLDGNMYNGVTLRYTDNLPPLRLMDTVNYAKANEKEKPEVLTYMVCAAHFFISGNRKYKDEDGKRFSVAFELRGIQDLKGQMLPDSEGEDPGLTGN